MEEDGVHHTYGVMGIKGRCFEPSEGAAKGTELPCLAPAEDASLDDAARGVSRTSLRNCWLFIASRRLDVYDP